MIIAAKSYFYQLLSHFPTKLPVGRTAYDKWLASILSLTGPIADEMSLKWVISNEIMRLPPGRDRKSKAFFVQSIRKFACNQVAASVVLEIKEQQEAISKQAQDKEKEAKPEDTGTAQPCLTPNTKS